MTCAAIVLSCFIAAYTPPPEYDYKPTRPYTVRIVDMHQMIVACKMRAWGCAILPKARLVLIFEGLLKHPEAFNIIVRHELAHLNGWRHD